MNTLVGREHTLSREKARGQMCCENAEYAKQKNAYTADRNMLKNLQIKYSVS